MKISKLFFFIYLIINLLFLFKYGMRQNTIPVASIMVVYAFVVTMLYFYKDKIFSLITNFSTPKTLQKIFIGFAFVIALALFFIIFYTDGNSLNVDRWSAMHVAIEALLNGEYPYTAVDHLNQNTSNFPSLLLIGLPFYLLGNVGYLEVFSFGLLVVTLYKTLPLKSVYIYLFFLLISPAYWWEIFAISDLLSNIIIVFCFIILCKQYLSNDIFKYPVLFGVVIAILLLTRGVVFIPLVLFYFQKFLKVPWKNKLLFSVAFTITFVLLIFMVLINCPDVATFEKFNPITLQTALVPNFVSIASIILPLILALVIKEWKTKFYTTIVLFLIPVIIAFVLRSANYGFMNMFSTQTQFDLSYFTMTFPFILYILSISIKKPEQVGN